jgi:hypothetical protein
MGTETMFEKYLQMFARLRTDKGRDRYPEITYHRAPHKPFVLLSVIDLIAQGRITENLMWEAGRDAVTLLGFAITSSIAVMAAQKVFEALQS